MLLGLLFSRAVNKSLSMLKAMPIVTLTDLCPSTKNKKLLSLILIVLNGGYLLTLRM